MKHMVERGHIGLICMLLMGFLGLIVSGCATTTREFILDSPRHRLTNGFRLLELGRIEDARREFRSALKLDPNCCEAYRGIGLSFGMQERFEEAFKAMNQARLCAQGEKEKALANVGFMRLTTLQKGKNWIDRTERFFLEALDHDPDSFEAYYYMGAAYARAKMFPKALWAYQKAVEIDGPFREKAQSELDLISKVIKANPHSELGQNIALKTALTRADAAALFVRELHVVDVYREKGIKYLSEETKNISVPEDITRHPFKKEIIKILRLGIQGLSLLPDGSFGPNMPISRSEFATMLAHIVRKVELIGPSEDQGREVRNPFEDVSEEAPYFADVILCARTTHVMQPDHGLFEPMELISGPEALLAIRKLKDMLGFE